MGGRRKITLKTQFLFLAASVILAVVIILCIFYTDVSKAYNTNNAEYLHEISLQNTRNISKTCAEMAQVLYGVSYSDIVQEALLSSDMLDKFVAMERVGNFSLIIKGMYGAVKELYIYHMDQADNYYGTLGITPGEEAESTVVLDRKRVYFSEMRRLNASYGNVKVFLAGTAVYYNGSSVMQKKDTGRRQGDQIGYVILAFDAEALAPAEEMRGLPVSLSLYDRNGVCYYGQEVTAGDKDYIAMHDDLPEISGKAVTRIDRKEMLAPIRRTQKKIVVIFLFAIIILSIPFIIILNGIVRPAKRLITNMHQFNKGELRYLKKKAEVAGLGEIRELAEEFNRMLDEMNQLTHRLLETNTRLYEASLSEKQAQIDYLQMQINPHFLYNTLEVIKGMALMDQNDGIFNMTQALARIFKYSVKESSQVTVESEFKIAGAYIRIHQIRFENRFSVQLELYDGAKGCLMPKLILQPLLENAVTHGLESICEGGVLTVSAAICGENLELVVCDNGAGMEPEKLEEIQHIFTQKDFMKLNSSAQSTGKCVGLENVHRRLLLIYGEAYTNSVTSGLGQGTEIMLRIPAVQKEAAKEEVQDVHGFVGR